VRLEEPCQAGPLRHLGKQRQIVARQPAVEGAGPTAFDGMQQGQRHDFTGIQFGLGVLRNVEHFLVHRVEQCDNKIWGSHRTGSSWLKAVQPQLEPIRDYLSTRTLMLLIKLTPLVTTLCPSASRYTGLVTQFSMRVQVPPSTCRSDSISP